MRRFLLASLLITLSALPVGGPRALAQKKAPDGAKVLLLSGGQRQHHGYRDQAFYLSNLLEDTGRFQATIVEDAAIFTSGALGKYDLVIALADRRDPEFKFSKEQQQALIDYVKSGHGYISIHGADNATNDWLPEMKVMLGGIFSHFGLPDGKTRKGKYTVHITSTSHPITKDISDFDASDELYYNLQMADGVEPLATIAYDGKDWPAAWTREFGKGRVFHTPMGHRDFGPDKADPLKNPALAKMIVQAADWAAGKSE